MPWAAFNGIPKCKLAWTSVFISYQSSSLRQQYCSPRPALSCFQNFCNKHTTYEWPHKWADVKWHCMPNFKYARSEFEFCKVHKMQWFLKGNYDNVLAIQTAAFSEYLCFTLCSKLYIISSEVYIISKSILVIKKSAMPKPTLNFTALSNGMTSQAESVIFVCWRKRRLRH